MKAFLLELQQSGLLICRKGGTAQLPDAASEGDADLVECAVTAIFCFQ